MTASYHLPLLPSTLVGATTRARQLSAPLRDRFGVILRLKLYSPEELAQVVTRSAGILGIPIEPEGALELTPRLRDTPRIANRLLRRACDFTWMVNDEVIMAQTTRRTLEGLEVDEVDLDANGRRMLRMMIEYCRGGPVGLDTLAAAIGEESVALEDVYEPYLIQIGFLSRTPCGHYMARLAYLHLGLTPLEDLTDAQ